MPPTETATLVDLGYAGPQPRSAHDLRHRLYHLPDREQIVVVQTRDRTGWRCAVIATHSERRPAPFTLTDTDLTTAATRITADPHIHRGSFLLLWQARVHQHWHQAHMDTVAHALSTTLRPGGSLHVDIDTTAIGCLYAIARLRPPALTILLNRLTTTGMLTSDTPVPRGHTPKRARLTLPELARSTTCRQHNDPDGKGGVIDVG